MPVAGAGRGAGPAWVSLSRDLADLEQGLMLRGDFCVLSGHQAVTKGAVPNQTKP